MAGIRNILITGGAGGIGLALADRLSKRHRVIVTGRQLSPALETLIGERPDLDFLLIDQMQPESIAETLSAHLAKRGWDRIDNAVLNAGIGFVCDPTREPAGQIEATMAVNLASNIHFAHCLYPYLKNAHGKLTFIGSTSHKGAKNFATYAATKGALHGFARALKEEWRGEVSVQILHPSATRTAMHEKAGFNPGLMRYLFVSADGMAQMVENAMARQMFSARLTQIQYWGGNQFLSRGLR